MARQFWWNLFTCLLACFFFFLYILLTNWLLNRFQHLVGSIYLLISLGLCCHFTWLFFSFQDRVMINRLDNICEAVLKGKWPVNRRQMFDFQGLLPGCTPPTVDSPLQKRSFAELSMVGQAGVGASEDLTASPQLSKVGQSGLYLRLRVQLPKSSPSWEACVSLVLLRNTAAVSSALLNSHERLIPYTSCSLVLKASSYRRSSLGSLFCWKFSIGRRPQPLCPSPAEEEEEKNRNRGRESCQAEKPHGDGRAASGVSGGLRKRTRESRGFIKGLTRGNKLYLKFFISYFKVYLA